MSEVPLYLSLVQPLTQQGSRVSGAIRLWRFPPTTEDRNEKTDRDGNSASSRGPALEGYLAHNKTPPLRTLQQDHTWGPMVVLGGGGVFLCAR